MPVVGPVAFRAVDPCLIGSLLQPIAVYCSFWARLRRAVSPLRDGSACLGRTKPRLMLTFVGSRALADLFCSRTDAPRSNAMRKTGREETRNSHSRSNAMRKAGREESRNRPRHGKPHAHFEVAFALVAARALSSSTLGCGFDKLAGDAPGWSESAPRARSQEQLTLHQRRNTPLRRGDRSRRTARMADLIWREGGRVDGLLHVGQHLCVGPASPRFHLVDGTPGDLKLLDLLCEFDELFVRIGREAREGQTQRTGAGERNSFRWLATEWPPRRIGRIRQIRPIPALADSGRERLIREPNGLYGRSLCAGAHRSRRVAGRTARSARQNSRDGERGGNGRHGSGIAGATGWLLIIARISGFEIWGLRSQSSC